MKTLYLLVGNIGSGKSTKATQMSNSCAVICRDKMRSMLGGGNYDLGFEWDISRACTVLMRSMMRRGVDIVIDETNLTKKYRREKILIAKEFGYKIIAMILPEIPKALSVLRRLNDDARGFDGKKWGEVFDSFQSRATNPTKEEGFDDIIQLS